LKEWSNVLFCGAFEGETDILVKVKGLHVLNVGVGLHESMYTLQNYLHKKDFIKSILFIGSAGAYPHSGIQVGDYVFSYKFMNKDLADIKKIAKVPDIVVKHLLAKTDPRIVQMSKNLGFKEIVSNSMNYVSLIDLSSEEVVDHLFDAGAENMEAFSIAYIASKLSIPFTAYYAITNLVGKNGSADWALNWRKASNSLQKMIIKYLIKK
jgi:nucleoside phosphorylase